MRTIVLELFVLSTNMLCGHYIDVIHTVLH